jgi:hypothetical protein
MQAAGLGPPLLFFVLYPIAPRRHIPQKKALAFVAAARLMRFKIEGMLAIYNDRWTLSLEQSPVLRDFTIGMIVVAIVASACSIYGWVRH